MPSDPTKPLLRLTPTAELPRPIGPPRPIPQPDPFPVERQTATFGPKFTRLRTVLERGDPLELRADATALAPERLLVFEVRGAIGAFANAIAKVPGLELIDEEAMAADEDKDPVAYLLMPDVAALDQLESLWQRWRRNELVWGETPWAKVFDLLRDLRPWGPADRVQPNDAGILAEEIEGLGESDLVRLELELVFRDNDRRANEPERQVSTSVVASGGRIVARSRIEDIAYHALLVDLPVWAVRQIINQDPAGIAGLDPLQYIRPQSIATTIAVADADEPEPGRAHTELGSPILALIDGVPVAAHPLLARHLIVDDAFGLEPNALVARRLHGTAMASLIVHGDRNRDGPALPRQIHVVPVLGNEDRFPDDRLVIDLIYLAVSSMRDGPEPTAPNVLIVNLSLGNPRRPFQGQLSAWARLLDRLAYRFGILFLVSAGNNVETFGVPGFATSIEFEGADPQTRATNMVRALGDIVADRRLFSPAETVNGVTIGACNEDGIDPAARQAARVNVDPYPAMRLPNPSSTLGPGYARSVKPDLLMPGAREMLQVVRTHDHIDVRPATPSRAAGLKVAAPPVGGREGIDGYTGGTSAAAALASRTCHRIHDALEAEYGETFTSLPSAQRAVLLKALFAHPARWPDDSAALLRGVLGPANNRLHAQQKDNIRRFLGYGAVDGDEAVACAEDRATFWAAGTLQPNKIATIPVPVPAVMGGLARPHSLSATLAWFTPVSPGRKQYRTCRLKILEPDVLDRLAVKAHGDQPDMNQTNRGTLYTRCWRGERAPVVGADMTISLTVQRDPDQGDVIDEPIPYGLAVSIAMPGLVGLYQDVRQRLQPEIRQPIR